MSLRSFLTSTLAGLFVLVSMYFGEYYLIGGFHGGWYYKYSYLFVIPTSVGILLLLFVKEKRLLKLMVWGLFILVLSAFFYKLGPLGTFWSELKFVLYHLPMIWFATLAFRWTSLLYQRSAVNNT